MANLNNLEPARPPRNVFQPIHTSEELQAGNEAGCQVIVMAGLAIVLVLLFIAARCFGAI